MHVGIARLEKRLELPLRADVAIDVGGAGVDRAVVTPARVDPADGTVFDAARRDAAAGDAAARDADPGDAGDAVRPGVSWTGWHGGDDDCIDVGEPLPASFCVGDYCLEQPSLPLERPLAVDGTAASDIYRLLPDRVLWHRGCSGWAVVPNAIPDEARCVSAAEQSECYDEVESENCAPVCTLVAAGPSSVWLLSDALWRFDGVAFRRWPDAPSDISRLQKVGDDVWVIKYVWADSNPSPPETYRLEDERFVRRAGGALEELAYPPRLHGIAGGDVWAGAETENGCCAGMARAGSRSVRRRRRHQVPVSSSSRCSAKRTSGSRTVRTSSAGQPTAGSSWPHAPARGSRPSRRAKCGSALASGMYQPTCGAGERFDGSAFHPVEYPASTFAQHAFGGSMWVSEGSGALARYADGGWQYELGTPDDRLLAGVSDFAGEGETLWMASGGADVSRFWRRGAAGFERVHEERGTYRLYVRAADDVWAYGERDGTARVLHWDGASWQPVLPPPPGVLIDLWSDGTTVLGLSAARLRSYASPVWDVVFDLPASVTASAMYVAELDDIWVIGARATDSAASLSSAWIGHWDGSELREIAAPARGLGAVDRGHRAGRRWIGLNFGAMRWEGGDWAQMAPEVPEAFERLLPAGEGNLLLCYHGRVQRWTGSDVEEVAIEPGWCPSYVASPTDFWATYVPAPGGENDYYYGVWHAQPQ